jgi:hypothetical protein
MSTDLPDHDFFARHVGEDFVATRPDGRDVTLRLAECDLDDAASGSFTLTFDTSADLGGQGTYGLRSDDLSAAAVFLVPSARQGSTTRYHAVFNHRTHPHEQGNRS